MNIPNTDPSFTIDVEADDVTYTDMHEVCICASDMDLKPGEWPHKITTHSIGNCQPFWYNAHHVKNGELLEVCYLQANGVLLLRVFND